MKQTVSAVFVVLAFLFAVVPAQPAAADDGDCSKLGKYEWGQFRLSGPLAAGYQAEMSFNSSAYRAPFTVHGFGITRTQYSFYQPPTIAIPANVAPGSHYVWVEQCGRKVAESTAYVNTLSPWAVASKWYVKAGETVTWDAYQFVPGEKVELLANGTSTGVSTNALDAYAPHHGVDYQGQIRFGIMSYKVPASLAGQNVKFELRGALGKTATTNIGVAR